MAVDSTNVTQSAVATGPSESPIERRRAAFRGLVFLVLGLICALVGQAYLVRHQYPLDGAVFYVVAVLLFYRGVRSLGDAMPAGAVSAYAYSWRRALPAVALGVAAFVVFQGEKLSGSGTFDSIKPNGYLGLALWLAAMVALAIAFWRQGLTEDGKMHMARGEGIALVGILLLGLVLRVYRLDSIPGNLYLDEGDHGLLAMRLINFPGYVHYVPDLTGHASLFFYGLGAWIKLFGLSVTAMRLYPILIGVLAIVAVYFLGREMIGPRAALAAAFIMAISRWHITFSRYIFTAGMLTLFMALVMFLLLRALRTRQPLDFVWTGIAFGLGFTAYLPIRFVLPAVVGVYLLFRVVGNRSFLRQHAHGLLMLALAFMLAFMPLGIYFYRFPDLLLARAQQASVQQDIERAGGSLQPLKDNITKAFGMFNYSGDPRARHNLPLAPMLDPITGIFFVLGLGYVILRWRRPENAILPAWLILGMVPGVMSLADSNPHSMRTIANLPAVCLLAALAAERAWTYVSENYGRRAVQRLLPVAAAIAVLALGANVVLYFNRQANDRSVYYDYDPVQTEVARQVLALGKTNQVFVAAAYTNHSAVKLLGAGAPYLTFNQTQHLPVRDAGDKDLTFILEPVHRQLQALFGQYYPAARFAEWKDRYGNLGFITVTVPRAAAAAAQGAIASYYRGTQPVGSAAVERAEESVSANWVNAPLDPPFAVSWRSALYVARYGPHTIILESSEPATVTLDNQVILTASNGVQSTALTLYGGFHALDVTAVVTKRDGLLNLRWKTPDGAEQAIPRSSLYSVDVAANGLLGKYYRGNAWAGAPAIQQKDLFIFPNDLLPAPFSIEWEGMIYAPQDGQYVFGSQSDDGSLVYIDGKLVVDNGGHHSDRYVEARVTLTQGLHDLRIRYFQDDGGRVMELYWIPPGGRKELVPNAALFPPNTVLTGPVVIPTQAPLPTAAPIQTPIAGRTPDARPPIPVVSSIGQIEPQMIIGREGSGPGEFRNPRGVAVDRDGNIYVADTGNKRVQKFDAQGNFIAEWKTAKDALVEPVGIAIGANGDVYVLEPERDGAHIFSANGEYRGKVGDGLGLYRPRGLSVDTSGVLYFANTGGNNVVRASANAQMLGTIGKTGKKTGELEQPTDVAVDLAGNIYVADTYNQRIQRFTPDGRFATQWAIPAAGTALGPHIAIAADGVLYVTDPDNHQVSAYSPDGAILATWGGQGNAEGQLVQPVGIFVDSSGLIYVADSGNHRIQVWGRR